MMNRICLFRRRSLLSIAMLALAVFATGCSPTQPFYFFEDGDLSHYVGMATNIDYPDTETCSLQEVDNPLPPLTISNPNFENTWDIKLEDAVRIALENGKVMRTLGVRTLGQQFNIARTQVNPSPDAIQFQPQAISTVYDVAIQESDPIFGPEGALAVYDPQVASSMVWNKNDRPQNTRVNQFVDEFQNRVFDQQLGTFQNSITKRTATGAEFAVRNNTVYDNNNQPFRDVGSDWRVNFEVAARQPLLQGAGSQYNRIAGPFDPLRGIGTYLQWDGVVIARIRTDIRLADFEAGVRDFVTDVENAYWELYFAYRNLEARKLGRDSALETWKRVHALFVIQARGGEADQEAQAREQYFAFRAEVETAQADLFRAENRLRFMMGLGATDGRLIRPSDEPSDAKVVFDFAEVHAEGLVRAVELRQQKWVIKQRELELIASKNLLLPRVDLLGTYRWQGLGHSLLDYNGQPFEANLPSLENTDAMTTLASGQFQEWEAGIQASLPLGFRRELAAVRNQQLLLARDRSVLQDQELELSHQLSDDIRNIDTNYRLTITNFNRRVAAERQVEARQAAYDAGTATLDLLLQAQRIRADAEAAYYRTLVDYNRAIMFLHYRKGSLLEYNGIYLAEGPWPAKAYFDATRRARARDAGMYIDYGFTRPAVFSQGPYEQFQDSAGTAGHIEGEPTMAMPEDLKQAPTPAVAPQGEMELPTPAAATHRATGPRLSQSTKSTGKPAVADAKSNRIANALAAAIAAGDSADESPKASVAKPASSATLKVRGGVQQAAAIEPIEPTSERVSDPKTRTTSSLNKAATRSSTVQHASAEDEMPYDWSDLPLGSNSKRSSPAKNTTSSQQEAGWMSPSDNDANGAAATGGWKRAR